MHSLAVYSEQIPELLQACIHFQASQVKKVHKRTWQREQEHPEILQNTSKVFAQHRRGIKGETKSNHRLRKVLLRLLDTALDPQQKGRLPLVQLAELVKLEKLISELLLITCLHGLDQVHEELVLSR